MNCLNFKTDRSSWKSAFYNVAPSASYFNWGWGFWINESIWD